MFVDFILLLLYSLLPGFAKVFDQQSFFLLNIPIIFLLLFRHSDKIKIKKIDVVFLFLFLYVLVQSLFSLVSAHINETALFMGIFMYFIPFVGFFYSRAYDFNDFVKIIMGVILIHCVLGILLYPAFGFWNYFEETYLKLHEGVAFGRMSSVSGSLGFANLMLVGFVLAYHGTKSKIYLIIVGVCLVMSLQRSAWLAAVSIIAVSTIVNFRFIGIKKIVFLSSFLVLVVLLLSSISSNEDFDILFSRFSEFGKEAASERSEQWVGGINNLLLFPQGAGVGQVGQISARYENNPLLQIIPDGDYLRIISEVGIVGLFFYFFIVTLLFYSITTLKINQKEKIMIVSVMLGYSIQMIGSNITEFYFTNFIYWIIVGYFFNLVRIEKIENKELKLM